MLLVRGVGKVSSCRRFETDIWGFCYTDDVVDLLNKPPHPKLKYPVNMFIDDLYKLKSKYYSLFFVLWWHRKKLRAWYYKPYVYEFSYPPIISLNANLIYVLQVLD